MTEWISVNDRLPENDIPCLVCGGTERDGYRMDVSLYVDRDDKLQNGFLYGCVFPVTHWMPLPNFPEGLTGWE